MNVYCPLCSEIIHPVVDMPCADHRVHEVDGTLDYIELAHVACAKVDNVDNPGYWGFDDDPLPTMDVEFIPEVELGDVFVTVREAA